MAGSGCNISSFFRAQELLGRRLPWFGASKMTSSGSRVVQLQHKTVFSNKCEPCPLCGIFEARLSSGTPTTPQGFDMSLLWVPRGHVALASAVLEGTLTECGSLDGVLCTGNSSEFENLHMVNFYPRPPHTCEGDRNLNPHSIVLGLIFCLQI